MKTAIEQGIPPKGGESEETEGVTNVLQHYCYLVFIK